MSIASEHASVNINILTDEGEVDPLSGNAVLNGIPVMIGRATVLENLLFDRNMLNCPR